MQWLLDNREWLFGGVLAAVVGGLIHVVFSRRSRSKRAVQKQKGGHQSVNLQAGRDLRIDQQRQGPVNDEPESEQAEGR